MSATSTAVPAPEASIDFGVPWHYGDPLREQRWLVAGTALVDLSHRGLVTVSGPDRLGWLNDLTTAEVAHLPTHEPRIALILDPNGRVEHELHMVDDGESTWISVEPATVAALVTYLRSMQFLLRVEITDRSSQYAVVGGMGTRLPAVADVAWTAPPEWSGTGTTPSGSDRGGDATKYVSARPAAFPAIEYFVPRDRLEGVLDGAEHRAGTWAWEALRVAAAVPRAGLETDSRSLPHELGWIGPAVHLAKGCYRGQEAVARTHNMGRPPRRLVLLHLDGSTDPQVDHGDEVLADGVRVGHVGTAAQHYELGPIATAVVKRRVEPDATLTVGGVAATQEPVVH